MKKLIMLLLISTSAFSQGGFSTEGKSIVWERIFPADNANIVPILERYPNLEVTGFSENVFQGNTAEIKNTCQGGSGLMKNNCKFDFVIMVNPDHYVVRISNLKIIEKYGPMQARVMANSCEKYFLDESKLKSDSRTLTDMGCLDSFLTSVFSLSGTSSGALTSN